ncbi:hypothetical protein [Azospirillum argentinense]|uniref:hypothetical protein n=1 Tax=Azospirillum argentinense TaxID=2970906 RepID=UPI003FD839E7
MDTIARFKRGERVKESTIDSMRTALEGAGVEFIPENGGGVGVRLRKARGGLRFELYETFLPDGTPTRCGLLIRERGKERDVILAGPPGHPGGSVTNNIKWLAPNLLNGQLKGLSTRHIHFYEYYPEETVDWMRQRMKAVNPKFRRNLMRVLIKDGETEWSDAPDEIVALAEEAARNTDWRALSAGL